MPRRPKGQSRPEPPPPSENALGVIDGTVISSDDHKHVEEGLILQCIENGQSYREIAARFSWPPSKVFSLAKNLRSDIDDYRLATRKLLAQRGLDAIEQWDVAMHEAAKQGKHLPAKDLLLHAGLIDPVQESATSSVNVAIVLGQGPTTLPPSDDE